MLTDERENSAPDSLQQGDRKIDWSRYKALRARQYGAPDLDSDCNPVTTGLSTALASEPFLEAGERYSESCCPFWKMIVEPR